MKKTIQAKCLTSVQLKMLDIGAPVIIPCETLEGVVVHVRLQTKNLQSSSSLSAEPSGGAGGHAGGCWESHGVYVAIMPSGVDYGS
jgi:hypothetical protein